MRKKIFWRNERDLEGGGGGGDRKFHHITIAS